MRSPGDKTNTSRRTSTREILTIELLMVAVLGMLFGWLGRGHLHLFIPLAYGGDGLGFAAQMAHILREGTFYRSSYVAAPFSLTIYDFPTPYPIVMLIGWLLGWFTKDVFIVQNLVIILGFELNALAFYFCSRMLKQSRTTAFLFALLFSFTMFAFSRSIGGHIYLAQYYGVALAGWLAFAVYYLPGCFVPSARERIGNRYYWLIGGTLFVLMVVGFSGFYYVFFAGGILSISGLLSAVRRRKWQPLVVAVVLIAGIGVFVVLAISPSILWWLHHGRNAALIARQPVEQEYYGLRLTDLIMPIFLAFHRTQGIVYRYWATRHTEGLYDYPGIIAVLSLMMLVVLALLLPALRRLRILRLMTAGRSGVLVVSAVCIVAGIVFAVPGGFGGVFSWLVSPELRAQNRISPYLDFFALISAAAVFDAFFRTNLTGLPARKVLSVVGALFVIGTLFLQTRTMRFNQFYAGIFHENQQYFSRLESMGFRQVFQFPVVAYPEMPGVNKLYDYDYFKPYLHTEHVHWSYGAVKGTWEQKWQAGVAARPPDQMEPLLALSGFDGILVQRLGYTDNGSALLASLTAPAGKPPVLVDQRWALVDLRPLRDRLLAKLPMPAEQAREVITHPLVVDWRGHGFSNGEAGNGNIWRWDNSPHGTASFVLVNRSGAPRKLSFTGDVVIATNAPEPFTMDGCGTEKRIEIRGTKGHLEFTLTCPPGRSEVTFSTPSPRVNAPQDPRTMHFRFLNYHLTDVGVQQVLSTVGLQFPAAAIERQ